MADVRTAPSVEPPKIFKTEAPFSNFSFIETNFGISEPIKRIFSQARMSQYKTLIMEKIENVGSSKDDDADLQKAGITNTPKFLIRLSFFTSAFNTIDEIKNQN